MICIKTFANVFEAEVAARTLEAHGLTVRLSSDDGGLMIPSGFGGVQLFVEDADADRAVTILTAPTAKPTPRSFGGRLAPLWMHLG